MIRLNPFRLRESLRNSPSRLGVIGSALTLLLGAGSAVAQGRGGVDAYHAKVAAAGYAHRVAEVNGVRLSYWEGPDNGPPLVLLHAQFVDWYSYSRVLPALSVKYHVYDIDYPGHGETRMPAGYPMTANRIGADLGDFIDRTICKPVFLTGNSSGGLLATWLAANRPTLVRKALLEDPPLFASEYPAIKQTIAYKSFATSYSAATKDHPADFLSYWIDHRRDFFRNRAGPGVAFFLKRAVNMYQRNHPDQPAELPMLAGRNLTVFMLVRGLSQYDPRFGAAFYDGSWNYGIDHAAALAKIRCPVLLMQANWSINDDGLLNGAMTKEQADRAMSLLRHGTYLKVDADHVVNVDKPDLWLKTVQGFFVD
jgi:pimeloyl-ACP methyl ester carboxylesterase